jgi:hypothetical protein
MTIELPMALEMVSFPPIVDAAVKEEILIVFPVMVEKEPSR